eukprot:COSAG04_NODE_765_length_10500_cov_7.566869_3_plen_315_part_00
MLDTGKHCDLLPAASKWGWHLSCFSKLVAADYLCFVKRPDDSCSWKCLLFLPADAFRLATGLCCGLCCWVCCELTDIDKDLTFGDHNAFDSKCCEPQRPQQPVPAAVAAPPKPEPEMGAGPMDLAEDLVVVDEMDVDDAREVCTEEGLHVDGDETVEVLRQRLRAHFFRQRLRAQGKGMTPREVFRMLDKDGSGYLDREEVEKASGVLGADLGFIMSADELDRQFTAMDPDGDGVLSFDEFETWWKGVEAAAATPQPPTRVLPAHNEQGLPRAPPRVKLHRSANTTSREGRHAQPETTDNPIVGYGRALEVGFI